MWKVNHDELQGIPHRQFWRTVDRTENGDGTSVMRKNPPAQYHMVLDGQQRLQSLVLALGGDDAGFKLDDRDRAEEIADRRPRGRQPKYKHWSIASLCFDLDKFLEKYEAAGKLMDVDFREVLVWAITDSINGQSKWSKPDNYKNPLPEAFSSDCQGQFIRLSRLWQSALPNPNLKERDFRETLRRFLPEELVPKEKVTRLLEPLGEFMTTLRDVKLAKVTYLELVPFDSALWTPDTYNDAIVNIFTRLNTAGRTLTREDITFAWLKSNWDSAATDGKSARVCFEELREELASTNLSIEMDDLISAVSFLWSVNFNSGKLLANRDLLQGTTIRPMAVDLSRGWRIVREAILAVTEQVNERQLEYGPRAHYSSLNALAVVWTWLYLALQWEKTQSLSVPEKDGFRKKCKETLDNSLDRWLICSQWAGRWAGASNTAVAACAKSLFGDTADLASIKDPDSASDIFSARFRQLVSDLETDAVNYVNTVAAASRQRVSVYRTMLWVWNHLIPKRWKMWKSPLCQSKSKKTSVDVDHIVAFALWDRKLAGGLPSGVADRDDAQSFANLLGNCSLLEKTFNISKSDTSLKSFLEQIHEFKTGLTQNPWVKIGAKSRPTKGIFKAWLWCPMVGETRPLVV